jgi:hypothetical protein
MMLQHRAARSEVVAQVRETVDLVICRGERGDEARQDLVGVEVEARTCPLIISAPAALSRASADRSKWRLVGLCHIARQRSKHIAMWSTA